MAAAQKEARETLAADAAKSLVGRMQAKFDAFADTALERFFKLVGGNTVVCDSWLGVTLIKQSVHLIDLPAR